MNPWTKANELVGYYEAGLYQYIYKVMRYKYYFKTVGPNASHGKFAKWDAEEIFNKYISGTGHEEFALALAEADIPEEILESWEKRRVDGMLGGLPYSSSMTEWRHHVGYSHMEDGKWVKNA